jgi:GNAT superfamily N-acetyltransferase
MARHRKPEYVLALPSPVKPKRTGACVGLKLRSPTSADAGAMGNLLLDAYRGTIDDEGEDQAAALAVAHGYFEGENGRVLGELSVSAWRGPALVGICAVAWLDVRSCPFVAYVATASDAKRRGVGRLVLGESVRRASRAGHREIRAYITNGNTASERLFEALGFTRAERKGPRS